MHVQVSKVLAWLWGCQCSRCQLSVLLTLSDPFESMRGDRKTPRELTGLTPRELGVSEKSFRLDDLNDSDMSSDDESINSSMIASPRPPLPKTPRGSGGLTPRGGSHTPRGGLASPTGTRSLRPGEG